MFLPARFQSRGALDAAAGTPAITTSGWNSRSPGTAGNFGSSATDTHSVTVGPGLGVFFIGCATGSSITNFTLDGGAPTYITNAGTPWVTSPTINMCWKYYASATSVSVALTMGTGGYVGYVYGTVANATSGDLQTSTFDGGSTTVTIPTVTLEAGHLGLAWAAPLSGTRTYSNWVNATVVATLAGNGGYAIAIAEMTTGSVTFDADSAANYGLSTEWVP